MWLTFSVVQIIKIKGPGIAGRQSGQVLYGIKNSAPGIGARGVPLFRDMGQNVLMTGSTALSHLRPYAGPRHRTIPAKAFGSYEIDHSKRDLRIFEAFKSIEETGGISCGALRQFPQPGA